MPTRELLVDFVNALHQVITGLMVGFIIGFAVGAYVVNNRIVGVGSL